jgi:hypothetical protein
MSKITFRITRIGDNLQDYSVELTEEQMGMVYDALNEYGYEDSDQDDNPSSVIMNKLYNLLEF